MKIYKPKMIQTKFQGRDLVSTPGFPTVPAKAPRKISINFLKFNHNQQQSSQNGQLSNKQAGETMAEIMEATHSKIT